MLTATDIRHQLDAAGRAPQRSRGQNFLVDGNLALSLVRFAEIRPDDTVLEIGPGLGSLTLPLAAVAQRVIAVEIDEHLVPLLTANLEVAGCDNVAVIVRDARAVDYSALTPPPTVVVGNLPYNIGTQLTLELLDRVPSADRFIVTVQHEVAERFTAVPRTKAYGAVSVKIAAYGAASIVTTLPPTVFYPRPNVDSAAVRITRNSATTPAERAAIWPLIEAGFGHRRKTLRQSLASVLEDVQGQCKAAGIDHGARAEELQLEHWLALSLTLPHRDEPSAEAAHG
ncbi:MAG: 16S rRNA (adenine(1518)-N(6)/adenine(1519)-N(6))-dimethyltransferase RsmA [Acidimicrobiia bacterium]